MSSNTLSDVPARRGINNRAASPWAGWLIIGLLALGSAQAAAPDAVKARAAATYDKLPLYFEANRGQTNPKVKFLSRGDGYSLFLTATEAVFALGAPQLKPQGHNLESIPQASGKRNTTVLRMKLVDPKPHMVGLQKLPGKVNYFLGKDPKQWHTHVSTYAKVKYERVYPGIDLVYYGNQGQLEYDFVLDPGTDLDAINLAFHGVEKLEVNAKGDLV